MTIAQHEFARFVALHDDVQPGDYVLAADISTVGRSPSCQIVVARNIVSRMHARIERDGPRYVLRDAGSANGTFVNERRVHAPHMLRNGDLIGLGAPAPLLRFVDPDPTFEPVAQLRYDERRMSFTLGQRTVELAPVQFRLLRHLYTNAGDVCTRESCAEAIWGEHFVPGMDSQALDNVVASLRHQLREIDPSADYIRTRRGLGYELVL